MLLLLNLTQKHRRTNPKGLSNEFKLNLPRCSAHIIKLQCIFDTNDPIVYLNKLNKSKKIIEVTQVEPALMLRAYN